MSNFEVFIEQNSHVFFYWNVKMF